MKDHYIETHCPLILNTSIASSLLGERPAPGLLNFREKQASQVPLLINLILYLKILMDNQSQQIFGKRAKENKPIQVTLVEIETIKGQYGILKVYLNKTKTRCF